MSAAQKTSFESRLNDEAREEIHDALRAAYAEGYKDRDFHRLSSMPLDQHQAACWDESETKARIERGDV